VSIERSPGDQLRVLHLYAGNLYGGIETLLATLARFRDLGAPMVPEFGLCFRGRLWDELQATGATVHDLGEVRFSRPWSVWRARTRLRALLSSGRFDVVVCHACWPHALFAPVVRRSGVPLVFWAHDVATGNHWLERRASRTPPDLVLANSRFTASSLGHLFRDSHTEVQYLPVPPPPPMNRDVIRQFVRRDLGTPPDAVVIIMACRLDRCKGHGVLLDALGRLTNVTSWECWIAGGAQRPAEAAYLEKLRETAGRLLLGDRVRFLGQRGDIYKLLTAADIYCQPNISPDAFGIAFVEALNAGLPVVTTALGGAVEIVDDSCGRLVEPGDSAALAKVLHDLMSVNDQLHSFAAAGRLRAAQLFAPTAQIPKLAAHLGALFEAVAA
jgi:glycosyltransferase involved in cell wall biosynthesis